MDREVLTAPMGGLRVLIGVDDGLSEDGGAVVGAELAAQVELLGDDRSRAAERGGQKEDEDQCNALAWARTSPRNTHVRQGFIIWRAAARWPRCRCQARKAHLTFTKDNNYLTHITNAARPAKIADTLAEERAKGRLTQVCEQWIYATRLCFALDSDQQERTGFHYSEATIASTSWLLRAVGARNGCVLVLEDLHWADPDTLAVLEYLSDHLDEESIACLITLRSDEPGIGLNAAHACRRHR
jgi:hypothetical protein